LAATYYNLYGGGVGGPIEKGRTFFWFASEGYRDSVPQGLSQTWPSDRQRNSDFSTTTLSGRALQIYNPYCRAGVATAKCPATGTGSLETGGVFVVNSTNVLSDSTVLSFRYGFSIFPDGRNCRGGSPGAGCFTDGLSALGFSQTYLNEVDATAKNLFPTITFQNFMTFGQNLNT